jgi:hypothetical protein
VAGRVGMIWLERMAGKEREEEAGGALYIGGRGPVCIPSSRTS